MNSAFCNIENDKFSLNLIQYYNIENYTKYNFTNIDRTPFTYLIGWSKTNMFYYGVRWSKGCLPSDIMNTYFTSSKIVSKYIKENDYPDIIIIDKIFDNNENAREYEHQFLAFYDAKTHDNFLNKSNGGKYYYNPNNIRILCEHCNTYFNYINYYRWHGDKCYTIFDGERIPVETKDKMRISRQTMNKIYCKYCDKNIDVLNFRK